MTVQLGGILSIGMDGDWVDVESVTPDYPTESQVLDGVSFGDGTYEGNVVLPTAAQVLQGVDFGPSGSLEGTLDPADDSVPTPLPTNFHDQVKSDMALIFESGEVTETILYGTRSVAAVIDEMTFNLATSDNGEAEEREFQATLLTDETDGVTAPAIRDEVTVRGFVCYVCEPPKADAISGTVDLMLRVKNFTRRAATQTVFRG